jgi:hypothetical protein
MKVPIASLLKADPVKLAIGVSIVGVVAYFLLRKAAHDTTQAIGTGAKKAADAVANINEGTPYEGAGVVGTLGHAADAVSGGNLSKWGEWLGGKLDDWFGAGGGYDPNK